jgi:GxxExxY protein
MNTACPRENQLGDMILECAVAVHRALGPGLLETIYTHVLEAELRRMGVPVEREVPVTVRYRDMVFDRAFFADLLVDGRVLVELKSVETLQKVHHKQVLTYLKLMDLRLGYLLNFGAPLLRDGIHRIVNGLDADRPGGGRPASTGLHAW